MEKNEFKFEEKETKRSDYEKIYNCNRDKILELCEKIQKETNLKKQYEYLVKIKNIHEQLVLMANHEISLEVN